MPAPSDPHAPDTDPQLADTLSSQPTPGRLGEVHLEATGYDLGELLGRGGMGEVVLARDRRIGRQVAIKRMRDPGPSEEAIGRFLREAHVQAHLDHPAIPPVYDIGAGEDGRPYFTMKRLSGVTLVETLTTGVPLQRLLRAFVEVCFAIDYAHSRGVIHRDLKPSNMMLGAFGEVYVLDWGVAHVDGESADTPPLPSLELAEHTQTGALLGTPGYMAPEQARGEPVTPAADVYALGATLFEILAGEPLHPRSPGAVARVLADPAEAPAARAPGRAIPPELDELCLSALAEDPSMRPAARALAERIQRYLDGDRDVARRRALAAEHLAQAELALGSGDRMAAMHLAGRSLALDPASVDSAALVTRLMLEPPRELPAELVEHLDGVKARLAHAQWKVSGFAFLSFVAFVPFLLWQGVTSWPTIAAIYVLVAALIAVSFSNQHRRRPSPTPALALNFVLLVLMSRMLGPFLLVPSVICVQAQAWVAYPTLVGRTWWRAVALLAAGIALPIALEALHVLASTWQVTDHVVTSRSAVLALGGAPTAVLLIASTLVSIGVSAWFGRSLAVSRQVALDRVEIQAWHLRHLLPRPLRHASA